MSPASWEKVKEVFTRARAFPEAEREAYLKTQCQGDTALADEVRALLGAEGDVPGFLDTTAEEALGSFSKAEPDLREPGQVVGPWVLERRVGAGGMGTVWRCHRASEPETPYAIKFMRRGLDTALLLHRFAMERHTLAALDHPNVAALVDAGVDANDRPFLVMEFVDGEPLDRWCDRRRLGVRARVDLFRDVCSAVHHAHRSLVVHRDLKPANILVTDAGIVKLLDFGVAKMLGVGDRSDTETATSARLITPRYASPEQLLGGHVGTPSDVYSLGIILYELLAGRTPFPHREGTIQEAREDAGAEPPRPSQVLDDASAEQRGTRLETLRRQLRGDLDTIVLAAVRTDADRRYASAGHLAEDLERHFSGLPVKARGDSLPYLFTTWTRRHRGLVASILIFTGLSLGGVIGIARQAHIARREADSARAEFESREKVVEMLIGLFESAAADNASPENISALDLIESGAAELADGGGGDDKVRAKLMATVGRVLVHLGRPEDAESLLEDSLALRTAIYGERHPDVAESLAALGELRRVQGRITEAEELLRRAIATFQVEAGEEPSSITWAAVSLGLVLMDQEQFAEAETWLELAGRVRTREYSAGHTGVLVVKGHLALIRFRQERYADAEAILREVLAEQEKRPPDLHLAFTLNNLGLVLLRLGRADEAEKAFVRTLETRQSMLPSAHPDLAVSFNNLALARYELKLFPQAALDFHEAARLTTQRPVRDPQALAMMRLNESRSLLQAAEPAKAADVLSGALAEAGSKLPGVHPLVLALLQATGAAQMQLRQGTRAVATYEELERRLISLQDVDPWPLARVRVELGAARLMDNYPVRAEVALAAALEVLHAQPEKDPELVRRAEMLLAEAKARPGRG